MSVNETNPQTFVEVEAVFDPPELTFVGDACRVVMGMPGGGFDGPYGMSPPEFEFEEDLLES